MTISKFRHRSFSNIAARTSILFKYIASLDNDTISHEYVTYSSNLVTCDLFYL